ncbi:cytochrome P450 [Conidiobolus coronatus NRRL 28638]|uniref:Cytochrome P450 n=1 Tax=Conidiobolus coronatus (strain ATCC 28846 / CBS 209.66 / NRRL 28638) TaxID=796925 RepID=A0A137PH02_CONC2|nr:cytochrome P450 [Conidiobolus coronatus NRRL 28638]|eukprot:KXN74268.1 cytochrome P450 [Conidiobolus coronatus NRRL 28638]
MISPAFNWKSVLQLEPQISLHVVDNTIAAINEYLAIGSTQVDVYELFHKSIADAISDLGLKLTIPGINFLKSRHRPIINQSIVEELKECKAGKYRKDILQTLVDAKDTETNSTFTDQEIIEEASILIFAGMETTAVALIWTLYLLEELINTFPDKSAKISYDMSKNLPYSTAVIHGSLRIKSPIGLLLPRAVPEEGITLCGHYLPEGVSLFNYYSSSASGIHLSERNFQDPESFTPERWSCSDADELKDMLFAFSLGTRGCVGMNLAWLEMYISLANVTRQFDFTIPEGTELTGFGLLVLKGKEEKPILNIIPRSN